MSHDEPTSEVPTETRRMTSTNSAAEAAPSDFQIQELTLDHPWSWLARGWSDLRHAPLPSLGYGLIFVLAGYALFAVIVYAELFYLLLPLLSGFFLVGPVAAVGLYEISRRHERGQPVSLGHALGAWRANGGQIAVFGMVLMLVFIAWMQLVMLIFALLHQGVTPTWESFVRVVFLQPDSFPLLLAALLLGGVLATIVFAMSALAVPLLMDRTINALDAMRLSVQAVRRNARPMLLWATIIAAFTGIGLVTFLLGLLVMLPLIGHATWHAYRDTLGHQQMNRQ